MINPCRNSPPDPIGDTEPQSEWANPASASIAMMAGNGVMKVEKMCPTH